MVTTVSQLRKITTLAGVEPSTDETPWNTQHYTDSLGIRFRNGMPEKIGGNLAIDFDKGNTVAGVPRSYFSQIINGKMYSLIGTHTRLYCVLGSQLTNITPVKSTTVAVGANLTTDYVTLANDSFATVNGSKTITVTKAISSRYRAGDSVTISGAATTNGIPDTDINGAQVVRSVSSGSFTIQVATAATSTGAGGGASIVVASGLVEVAKATHGLTDGDRIKITAAVAVGGITAPQINLEFIIRVTASGTFDIYTAGVATSSATGSGGTTVYQEPIDAGDINVTSGMGYGAGRYGVGLYGVSKVSTNGNYSYPRIWCFDRFGALIICSPGNGGLLYEWDGNPAVAPVKVANSPDAINWFFVSDNIIVTFGAATGGGDQIENRILSCDQSDRTNWTSSSTNQVYDDAIEGAGRFISQVNVRGVNLIYTFNQVYTFEYIGLPNVWRIKNISNNSGLVGPNARIEVNGVAYWMGQQNLYMFSGSRVEVIRSNSSPRPTNQRFVFTQLSTLQRYKAFVWYNEPFEEINFHYPSQSSGEVDLVSRYNLIEQTWACDEVERTCAEYPYPIKFYPRMAGYDGSVYQHEFGYDNDEDSQPFSFTTNRLSLGKKDAKLTAFIPDGVQSGSVTVTIRGYQWPQSTTPIKTLSFTVDPTSGRQAVNLDCRYWTYTIEGDSLGQSFGLGGWQEEIQQAGDGA